MWSNSVGRSIFGIGEMRAIFHAAGKDEHEIKELMMCVSGEAIWSAASFKNFIGILSAPVEQSDLIDVN